MLITAHARHVSANQCAFLVTAQLERQADFPLFAMTMETAMPVLIAVTLCARATFAMARYATT
jgi:hypothetical protein